MEESKSLSEKEGFLNSIKENELYKVSKSVHKDFEFMRYKDLKTDKFLEGQIVRKEDDKGRSEREKGFDALRSRIVILNFKNGMLHAEGDDPAVQYPGHWEYWENGMIKKVVSDYGDTEEYWEGGVPVRIERNLSLRREKGECV